MSPDDEPAWPGADPKQVSLAAAGLARRLSRMGARTIGFLAVAASPSLVPLVHRIAAAMAAASSGLIGVIDGWRTWSDGARSGGVTRTRTLAPRVVGLVPPGASGPAAAEATLDRLLDKLPDDMLRVLVDLSGLAPPGIMPGAARLVDGTVLVVPRARVPQRQLASLARKLPDAANLGAILLG